MPARLCLLLALTDAAPLSAPAFSLVFPFLKMVLTELPHNSEEEEERMAQILQILTIHAQLRASPSHPPGRVDEVGRGARLHPWFEWGQGGRGPPYVLDHQHFWQGSGVCACIYSSSHW